MTAAGTITGPQTLAVVARYRAVPTANWPVAALSSTVTGAILRRTDGLMNSYVTSVLNLNVNPSSDWHVFLATFNGTDSTIRIDDTEALGNTGPSFNSTVLNTGHGDTGFAKIDVADILVWNRALTLTERNKIVTDLKAAYGI